MPLVNAYPRRIMFVVAVKMLLNTISSLPQRCSNREMLGQSLLTHRVAFMGIYGRTIGVYAGDGVLITSVYWGHARLPELAITTRDEATRLNII
jgi:hypothetical protein